MKSTHCASDASFCLVLKLCALRVVPSPRIANDVYIDFDLSFTRDHFSPYHCPDSRQHSFLSRLLARIISNLDIDAEKI